MTLMTVSILMMMTSHDLLVNLWPCVSHSPDSASLSASP